MPLLQNCHDGTVWEITCENPEVIEYFGEVFGIIKSEIPSVTDYRVIESIALERIIERNGEMKWFRMRKVRSS